MGPNTTNCTYLQFHPVLHHLGYSLHHFRVLRLLYKADEDVADETPPHVRAHHPYSVLHQIQTQDQQLRRHSWNGEQHRMSRLLICGNTFSLKGRDWMCVTHKIAPSNYHCFIGSKASYFLLFKVDQNLGSVNLTPGTIHVIWTITTPTKPDKASLIMRSM